MRVAVVKDKYHLFYQGFEKRISRKACSLSFFIFVVKAVDDVTMAFAAIGMIDLSSILTSPGMLLLLSFWLDCVDNSSDCNGALVLDIFCLQVRAVIIFV